MRTSSSLGAAGRLVRQRVRAIGRDAVRHGRRGRAVEQAVFVDGGRQGSVWSIDSGYQSGSRFGLRRQSHRRQDERDLHSGGRLRRQHRHQHAGRTAVRPPVMGGLTQGGWGAGGRPDRHRRRAPARSTCGPPSTRSAPVSASTRPGRLHRRQRAAPGDNAALYVTPVVGGFKERGGLSFNRSVRRRQATTTTAP